MIKLFSLLQRPMETERLLLRKWRSSDFEDFLKFASDPQVMLASGAKPAGDSEEAGKLFGRARRDSGCYAIVLKKTNAPIGQIKFQKDIRRYRVDSLSIAYELSREYWGQGLMPEALAAMVRRAFEQRGAEALGIAHFTVNERSRRVIEKCGFVHEGTIRHAFCRYDGAVFDDECYSILREEYESGAWQRRLDAGCGVRKYPEKDREDG